MSFVSMLILRAGIGIEQELKKGLRAAVWTLRPTLAGVFLLTSTLGPGTAWAQSRSMGAMRGEEYSSNGPEGDYFSPKRLRERMEAMEVMIAGYNARFSRLQGRPETGLEEVAPRVFELAMEKFMTAGAMSAEVEEKRAQVSAAMAGAGGFRYRSYPDGKREWHKNGRLYRVENEKILDENGNERRQDMVDLEYDNRGNLTRYRTETRDHLGHITTARWEGTYNGARGKNARLLGFTERRWDALGNETVVERRGMTWSGDGKNLIGYEETQTDQYGKKTNRTISESRYDEHGNITFFKEEADAAGGKAKRVWESLGYEKYQKDGKDAWRLTGYKERSTDAQGRNSEKTWEKMSYDASGRLLGYEESGKDAAGKVSVKTWKAAGYDKEGNLIGYRETVKSDKGIRERGWSGATYDSHGRLLSFKEVTRDENGVTSERNWGGAEYNARGELLRYEERSVDGYGVESRVVWAAVGYDKSGNLRSYTEETTKNGQTTKVEWDGVYDKEGRLVEFRERNTDGSGNVQVRGRRGMAYDAYGRMVGYEEEDTDAFGEVTWRNWAATGFDAEDRATGYEETWRRADGSHGKTTRQGMTYNSFGQLTGYAEDTESEGLSGRSVGHRAWGGAEYDAHGQLTRYEETNTESNGASSTRAWNGSYDGLGRLVETTEEKWLGDDRSQSVVVKWKAKSFDAQGRVTAYSETTTGGGEADKERTWSGRYNERGLLVESEEVVSGGGLTVTTTFKDAVYDAHGRLVSGVERKTRSDNPGHVDETIKSGLTYDEVGRLMGGREERRVSDASGASPLDVKTIKTYTGGTTVTETVGVDEHGVSLHTRDTVEVVHGALGAYQEKTRHEGFDESGGRVVETYGEYNQGTVTLDMEGRALSWEEESWDSSSPEKRLKTTKENVYSASGSLVGDRTRSVDQNGLETVTVGSGYTYDVSGRRLTSLEVTTYPGWKVTTDRLERNGMKYDALGRLIESSEKSLSEGPGLHKEETVKRTTTYDGAGRVLSTTEVGKRDGVDFETITTNTGFDRFGRPVAYHREERSEDGTINIYDRKGITFDGQGRTVGYTDAGYFGGTWRDRTVGMEYDAMGREVRVVEDGFDGATGAYHNEEVNESFNELGQVTAKRVTGSNATDGPYDKHETNLTYDSQGRVLQYDLESVVKGERTLSQWVSKGVDAFGRSLGYVETGKKGSADPGATLYDFVAEHAPTAFNAAGQVTAQTTVTTKWVDGVQEVTKSTWTGSYDDLGRLTDFENKTETTKTENGASTTSVSLVTQNNIRYYESDGTGHRKGQVEGYEQEVWENGTSLTGKKVVVRNQTYDEQGLSVERETISGDLDPVKTAFRGLLDLLKGDDAARSKAQSELMKLVGVVGDLGAMVSSWLKEKIDTFEKDGLIKVGLDVASDVAAGVTAVEEWFTNLAKGVVGDFAAVLGTLFGGSSHSMETILLNEIEREAHGMKLEEVPLNLQPAAEVLGVYDSGLSVTRAIGTEYDALGRATSWREITVNQGAPTLPVLSEVAVTYRGDSSRMESYDARTQSGEAVSHLYRNDYTYDVFGKATRYMETTFEGGDAIEILDEAALEGYEGDIKDRPHGAMMDWQNASKAQREQFLKDVLDQKIEIVGQINYQDVNQIDYDAAGNVVNTFGERTTRGNAVTDFGEGKLLVKSAEEMKEDIKNGIAEAVNKEIDTQTELVGTLESDLKIKQDALDKAEKDFLPLENDVAAADKALADAKKKLEDLKSQLTTLEAQAKTLLATGRLIFAGEFTYSPMSISSEEKDKKTGIGFKIENGTKTRRILRVNEVGNIVVEDETYSIQEKFTAKWNDKTNVWDWTSEGKEVSYLGRSPITPGRGLIDRLSAFWRGREGIVEVGSASYENLKAAFNVDATIGNQVYLAFSYKDRANLKNAMDGVMNVFSAVLSTRDNVSTAKTNVESKQALLNTATEKRDGMKTAIETQRAGLSDAAAKLAEEQEKLNGLTAKKSETIAQKTEEALGAFEKNLEGIKKMLLGSSVYFKGESLKLTDDDVTNLMNGGTVGAGDKALTLSDLTAGAVLKTSLAGSEKFANFNVNDPAKGLQMNWTGGATFNGQVLSVENKGLLKQLATAAGNASAQSPPASGATEIPGLHLDAGAHFTATATLALTKNTAGQATHQKIAIIDVIQGDTGPLAKITYQDTKNQTYDAQGHLMGFERITTEGTRVVTEIQTKAEYNAQGRATKTWGTFQEVENGLLKNQGETIREVFAWDAAGRSLRGRTTMIKGSEVTVSVDVADTQYDAHGRVVFNLVDTVQTGLGAYQTGTVSEQHTLVATWNAAFNDRGDVLAQTRLSLRVPGKEGAAALTQLGAGVDYYFKVETVKNLYDASGKLTSTSIQSQEMGRTNGQLLAKSSEDVVENLGLVSPQVERTRRRHREAGQTAWTESTTDERYDGNGHAVESWTTTTHADGHPSSSHWQVLGSGAAAFDEAGRPKSYMTETTEGGTTTVEVVSEARYDGAGRLIYSRGEEYELGELGQKTKQKKKEDWNDSYNLFGQLVSGRSVVETTDADTGKPVRETYDRTYDYDGQGRMVKTTTNGKTEFNGQTRSFTSVSEVVSFDVFGRALRTKNTDVRNGVTTVSMSKADIEYTADGKVSKTSELVHSTGFNPDGSVALDHTTMVEITNHYNEQGRLDSYVRRVVDGGLATTDTYSGFKYDENGKLVDQTVESLKTSVDPAVTYQETSKTTTQGMKYNGFGDLIGWDEKKVEDRTGVRFSEPVLITYDAQGNTTTFVEHWSDDHGNDLGASGLVGATYNSLGQQVTGANATLEGTNATNAGVWTALIPQILAGAFKDDLTGGPLLEKYKLNKVSATATTKPNQYDLLGRLVESHTRTDAVGTSKEPPVYQTYDFSANVNKNGTGDCAAQYEAMKAQLQAQGYVIDDASFYVGRGGSKNRRDVRYSIKYHRKYEESHVENSNKVVVFDSLNRAAVQESVQTVGAQVVGEMQFLSYNPEGLLSAITKYVTEQGNGFTKTSEQTTSFTYDEKGRAKTESTTTRNDSSAPGKVSSFVVEEIKYNDKNERVYWKETSQDNTTDVVKTEEKFNVTYDTLGRVYGYDSNTTENGKLSYVDRNVKNVYDGLGRLEYSERRRIWGEKIDEIKKMESGALAPSLGEVGSSPGGQVAGLDENWTSGDVVLKQTMTYNADGTLASNTTVANGSGVHSNGEVQAAGIHLTNIQSEFVYDNQGRAVRYRQQVSQVEHYSYVKQTQKGLKRKNKQSSGVGSITTESVITVLEFDGFGRQTHTIVESQRNDPNKTWTRTDTLVKSFDAQGRALDVERKTESKMTLPKSKGGFMAKLGTVGLLSVLTLGLGVGLLVAPIVAGLSSNATLLGGQKIHSFSHTVAQNQYKADGTLDEEATRAKTTTVEEHSYQQGKNWGDKVMMATDITVALVTTVIAVALAIVPGGQAGSAAMLAAASTTYQMSRSGISTHDLQVLGQERDREGAKQRAASFYAGAASVATAGIMSGDNAIAGFMSKGGPLAEGLKMGVFNAGTQMGVAQLSGADNRTLWQVGGMAAASGFLQGMMPSGGSSLEPKLLTDTQIAVRFITAGVGELMVQLGGNPAITGGSESRRQNWVLFGSALKAGGGNWGSETAGQFTQTLIQTSALHYYNQLQNGTAGDENAALRRTLINSQGANLLGSAINAGLNIGAVIGYSKFVAGAKAMGMTQQAYGEHLQKEREIAQQKAQVEAQQSAYASAVYSSLGLAAKAEQAISSVLDLFPTGSGVINFVAQGFRSSIESLFGPDLSDPRLNLPTFFEDRSLLQLPLDGSLLGERFNGLESPGNGYLRVKPTASFEHQGKVWNPGSLFAITDKGLVLLQGTTNESSFPGLKWKSGTMVPVAYQRNDAGELLSLGIDFSRVKAGTRFTVTGEVSVPYFGLELKAGSFLVGKEGNLRSLGHGTVFKSIGEKQWKIYVQSADNTMPQVWQVSLNGNKFRIERPEYELPDQSRVEINSTLTGSISGGVASWMAQDISASLLTLTGEGLRATGVAGNDKGFLRIGTDGRISFNRVKLFGTGITEGMEGVLRETPQANEATAKGVVLPPGKDAMLRNIVTIKAYFADKNLARVFGEFMLNSDQSGDRKIAFGIGSQILLGDDVKLQRGGLIFSQNGSHDYSEITASGFKPGNGIAGKVIGESKYYLFGDGGTPLAYITRTLEGGKVYLRGFMAQSHQAVFTHKAASSDTVYLDLVGKEQAKFILPKELGMDRTSVVHGALTGQQNWVSKVSNVVKSNPMNLLKLDQSDLLRTKVLGQKGLAMVGKMGVGLYGYLDAKIKTSLFSTDSLKTQNARIGWWAKVENKIHSLDKIIQRADSHLYEEKVALARLDKSGVALPGTIEFDAFKVDAGNLAIGMFSGGIEESMESLQENFKGGIDHVGTVGGKTLFGLIRHDLTFAENKSQFGSRVAVGSGAANLAMTGFAIYGLKSGFSEGFATKTRMAQGRMLINTLRERMVNGLGKAGLEVVDTLSPVSHKVVEKAIFRPAQALKFKITQIELQRAGFEFADINHVDFDKASNTMGVNLDSEVRWDRIMLARTQGHDLNLGTTNPRKVDNITADPLMARNITSESVLYFREQVDSVLGQKRQLEARQTSDLQSQTAEVQFYKGQVKATLEQGRFERSQIRQLENLQKNLPELTERVIAGKENINVFDQKIDGILSQAPEGGLNNGRGSKSLYSRLVEGLERSGQIIGKGREVLRRLGEGFGKKDKTNRSVGEIPSGEPSATGSVRERISETRKASGLERKASGLERKASGRITEEVGRLRSKNEITETVLTDLRGGQKEAQSRARATNSGVRATRRQIGALESLGGTLDQLLSKADPKAPVRFSTYIFDEQHAVKVLLKNENSLKSATTISAEASRNPSRGMSAKFRELISSERGHVLIETVSVKQVVKEFWGKLTGKRTASVSPNSSADGPPLLPSGEKTPVIAPSGKSVGAGAAHEFHRFTDYSEPMLINRGGHGADAVFKQSFESRVTPEFTNGGQKLVRYMAENKIDTINGRQLTPHELNTLATEVSQKIMTSPERSNSFVKDGNGNKLVEVWDEASQGGMLFTQKGQFLEFTGRIPVGKDAANLLPPVRAGPPNAQIIDALASGDKSWDFVTPSHFAGARAAVQFLKDQGISLSRRRDILSTFDVGSIKLRYAGKNEYGIRYYDGVKASPKGHFLFDTFPATREGLALKTEWNQIKGIKQWQIEERTVIIEGVAAPQGHWPGGAKQKYISDTTKLKEVPFR